MLLYKRGGKIINRWKDWYEQGKRDLERAKLDIDHHFFEWACFTAQQSAEKALKGVALKKGITIWGHSLTEILILLAENVTITEEIVELGKLLDIYYIPTRYPNGFSSGKPADYFTKKQAQEAVDAADKIIRFCESILLG